ncbi:MAG: hypothetical protein S4CHLAM123_10440 [Chlamydiales bacterium]|nr:hypothetical protein [Chlamydiales bacterium]
MRAIIKGFHSPEIDDLQHFKPEITDNFCFLLQLMIGPENEDGEESFDIEVCTPKWLLSKYKKDEIIFGRHMLIVFEYNFEQISNKLKYFVKSCNGSSWNEIAKKISKISSWEFESYAE